MNEKETEPSAAQQNKNVPPIVDDDTTWEQLQQYCEAEGGKLIIEEGGFITTCAVPEQIQAVIEFLQAYLKNHEQKRA